MKMMMKSATKTIETIAGPVISKLNILYHIIYAAFLIFRLGQQHISDFTIVGLNLMFCILQLYKVIFGKINAYLFVSY